MKRSQLKTIIQEELRKVLREEGEEESNPDYQELLKSARKAVDLVWNRSDASKDLKPFTKDMSQSGTKTINNIIKIAKESGKYSVAVGIVGSLVSSWEEYANWMLQTSKLAQQNQDQIEQKVSALAKEKIDLEVESKEKQKAMFDETFMPLLSKARENIKSLQDKEVAQKVNELIGVVLNNYKSGKYETATAGAAKFIATFFPNMIFTLWKNDFTKAKLPNTKTLELLDDYKEILANAK